MYETEFELSTESESEFPGESEWEFGHESSHESLEAELVSELMEITSEAELDRFLGKLASSVVKGAKSFIKSPIGKALGGVLKNVAKTALPAVGGALGSMVLPGVGTAIGSKLGSFAGGLLEVQEAEQLGEAEAEYEAAQRYVRFARASFANAARAPRNLPPRAVVRAASVSAARRYAPSLLRSGQRMSPRRRRSYGRQPWYYPEPAYWSGGSGDYDGNGYGNSYGNGYDEPEPWSGDGGEFSEEAESPTPPTSSMSRAPEGRWVRRGGRIVVLGA